MEVTSLKNTRSETTSGKMTRRDLLRKAGKAGITLAAAQAISPFILSGCGSKSGSDGGEIKVGILHSLTGTMAISESSLKNVEVMAITKINKAGAALGKQTNPIIDNPPPHFTLGLHTKANKPS